jgi:allantoin racemase
MQITKEKSSTDKNDRSFKILIINPNSTVSMTNKIREFATAFKAPNVIVDVTNPSNTPQSIEGHYDGAMSLRGLLEKVKWGEDNGYDGFIIACFDDTGLDACREIATGPVIGICEASVHVASMIAKSFSIVTTLPRSVPIIEDLVYRYGMDKYCRKVRAANIEVLSLENDQQFAQKRILEEINKAIEEDRCETVILGCAGMTDLTEWLSQKTGLPVIDGVIAALKLVEGIIAAGLKTSKVGGYSKPLPKEF